MTVDMSEGNENMDYPQHQRSFNLFIALVKYGTLSIAILLILMALFLV
jgi:hypothetical protein